MKYTTSLLALCAITFLSTPAHAIKRIRTIGCGVPGEVNNGCPIPIPTPTPPDDENSCKPYCSKDGHWCTDCNGNGPPAPLDEDGLPLRALELEEEGFYCSLIEIDGQVIGDCEVYGWICNNERCDDSEGHSWFPEASEWPLEIGSPGTKFPGCSTTGHSEEGLQQCNISCTNGFTASCVVSTQVRVWYCNAYGDGTSETIGGPDGATGNPCTW